MRDLRQIMNRTPIIRFKNGHSCPSGAIYDRTRDTCQPDWLSFHHDLSKVHE